MKRKLLTTCASIAVIWPSMAMAQQDDGAQDPEDQRSGTVGEIVVTAEKRSVNLQDVPLSVSAVTGEGLDKEAVIRIDDLSSKVPGLVVAKSEGFRKVAAIRGLGLEASQNDIANPSVSYHVDGVYIASDIQTNADLFDIERIEVLRGPQGTVFGQNAIGGAINVITKQPSLNGIEGNVDITIGTFDLVRARGVINIPLSDTLAIRGGASYLEHRGFSRNIVTGQRLDEEANLTARIALLWEPSPDFSATLRGELYDTADLNGRAQKSIIDPTPGARRLAQDFPSTYSLNGKVASLELKASFGDIQVKSITGYQDASQRASQDNDRLADPALATPDIVVRSDRDIEAFTQEINIVSDYGADSKFDWILGAFYLDYRINPSFLEFGDFNGDGVIDQTIDTVNPFSNPDLAFETNSRPVRESFSIYGQGTLHLTDRLRSTFGLRYTDDEITSEITNFFGAFGSTNLNVSTEDVTGKFDIQYDLTPENLFYFTVSRGFKPGGTNLTNGESVSPIYEDEEIWSYEIGSKNRFFDDRVQLNVAAFYYDYENLQFQDSDPIPFNGGVNNIPESEIYGIEGELTAYLTDTIRLDANASYLETEVTSDFAILDNVAAIAAQNDLLSQGFDLFSPEVLDARRAQLQNPRGNPLPKAPTFSSNMSLTWENDIASVGFVSASINWVHRDSYVYRLFNNAATDIVPSYDLFNVHLSWQPEASNWKAEIIATNIFDQDAVNSRFTDAFGVGSTSDELVPPNQYMLRIGYRF